MEKKDTHLTLPKVSAEWNKKGANRKRTQYSIVDCHSLESSRVCSPEFLLVEWFLDWREDFCYNTSGQFQNVELNPAKKIQRWAFSSNSVKLSCRENRSFLSSQIFSTCRYSAFRSGSQEIKANFLFRVHFKFLSPYLNSVLVFPVTNISNLR